MKSANELSDMKNFEKKVILFSLKGGMEYMKELAVKSSIKNKLEKFTFEE